MESASKDRRHDYLELICNSVYVQGKGSSTVQFYTGNCGQDCNLKFCNAVLEHFAVLSGVKSCPTIPLLIVAPFSLCCSHPLHVLLRCCVRSALHAFFDRRRRCFCLHRLVNLQLMESIHFVSEPQEVKGLSGRNQRNPKHAICPAEYIADKTSQASSCTHQKQRPVSPIKVTQMLIGKFYVNKKFNKC